MHFLPNVYVPCEQCNSQRYNAETLSIKYKGIYSKFFLTLFVISFFVLGYLGSVTSTPERTLAAQIFTVTYFAYFLLMPFYSKYEKCKPVPDRVQLS